MKLALIVAASQNRVIGRDNDLPWYLPEDLKRFKDLTLDHPVIMGRKTFDSIMERLGKPLPNRTNIVVSGSMGAGDQAGVLVAKSLDEALTLAKDYLTNDETAFVIGGAKVFTQTLELADIIYLTEISEEVQGDAFFPELDESWTEDDRSKIFISKSGIKYCYVTYKRK